MMPNDPTTREAFIARVRAGMGRGAPSAPPALAMGNVDEALVRLVLHGDNSLDLFLERASGVGMTTHRATLGTLVETVKQFSSRRAVISIEDASLRRIIESGIDARVDWIGAVGLDGLYDADCGITDVFGAIAETGTLVVKSSASTSRGGFLVPPVHVALVRASQVLPDMVDLWRLLQPVPTSVVLITGPSKTADIEGILITGVHGPREVHIVLIDDA